MEERNLIQPHRIRWYRFPAAPLNARSSKPFPAWIAVTLSFPLSGRWALSPSFPLCVSRCPTDDLRTLRRLPLFYYAKRGYLLCTIRNLSRSLSSLWTTVSLPPLAPLPFVSNVCFGVLSDAYAARTAYCRRQNNAWFFNENDFVPFAGATLMVFKP